MQAQGRTDERSSPGGWAGFVIWAVLGVIFGLSVVVFPPIGLVLIIVGGAMTTARPALRRSWFGALAGIGATLLYVAFVQRHGPGTVCWQTATASGCDEYLNPWPWFAAGTAFVIAGFAAKIRHARAIPGQRRSPGLSD